MCSESVETVTHGSHDVGAKGLTLLHTRLLFVNDLNLCDKDSFGCWLQFQHSVYRDHSNTVIECGDTYRN